MAVDLKQEIRIGVFGCGYIYSKHKNEICSDHHIEVLIDNDEKKQNTIIDDVMCIPPSEIYNYNLNLILVMSEYYLEIREQLMGLGYPEEAIIYYRDYLGSLEQTCVEVFAKDNRYKKKALIITNDLQLNGAPIAVLGLGHVLLGLQYDVTVAAGDGDEGVIGNFIDKGINIRIQKYLPYASIDNLSWALEYDEIFVNTLPMILCAIKLSALKHVYLWLHESSENYPYILPWKEYIENNLTRNNLSILAVSKIARQNFYDYLGTICEINILPVAVEDWGYEKILEKSEKKSFAVIGPIREQKGQDVFLEAAICMKNKKKAKFILIGIHEEDHYYKKIVIESKKLLDSLIIDEVPRQKIREIYKDIDFVVVPSKEETFSIVALETLMLGKVCIVTDNCGIAEYIQDKENGFVFPVGDVGRLAEVMDWCVENPEEVRIIGEKARETYVKNFSIEMLTENTKKSIIEKDRK